ncbi:LysR family transcriptional regulator [Pseudonocardia acaciae]|uniref:LysR family transcriptional regulator n=1 Tax=Pseudonocardia acaciae TaxID=551276 RepID=UPI0006845CAD|nr:LysR family transcriptional regulator [Pseudonocardia acaciae]
MSELTVQGLRVLREVASRGSFSAAADALGYTQSAVSRQVAALEAAAGSALFTRTNRGVRLTDAGAVLAGHAAAVLDRLAVAERELGARRGRAARLRLGAFPTAMAALAPLAIAELRAADPDLAVTLREGTTPSQLRRVAAGTVDVAIVGAVPEASGLEHPGVAAELLLDDPLLLAVGRGHRLAGASAVRPGELAGERWIVGSANSADGLLGAWPDGDRAPAVAFTARDWLAKLALVAAGLGVTMVPGLIAATVRRDVALVRVADPRASRPVLLARPAESTAGPARALVDALRGAAGRLTLELERRRLER